MLTRKPTLTRPSSICPWRKTVRPNCSTESDISFSRLLKMVHLLPATLSARSTYSQRTPYVLRPRLYHHLFEQPAERGFLAECQCCLSPYLVSLLPASW